MSMAVSVNKPPHYTGGSGDICISFRSDGPGDDAREQMAEFIAYLGQAAGLFDSKVLEKVHAEIVKKALL